MKNIIERLLVVSLLITLFAAPFKAHAQPTAAEEEVLEQRPPLPPPQSQTQGVHYFDLSTAFIRNAALSRRELAIGLRLGSPLWTSRTLWRLDLSLRVAAQAHVSFQPTFYTSATVEGGLRFVSLSFLSVEFFTGPQIGLQVGRFELVPVAGWAFSSAWLFHPFQDRRHRFRLGIELANLKPFMVETEDDAGWFPFRHIGLFIGYQSVF